MRYLKVLVITLFWVPVLFVPTLVQAQPPPAAVGSLLARVEALEQKVAELEAKLANVSVEDATINGLIGPHFIFEGVNVHIRSGSDRTDDGTVDPVTFEPIPEVDLLGLGNLVVGYNENGVFGVLGVKDRTGSGSHNLIMGVENSYTSFAGIVNGLDNTVSGPGSAVLVATGNTASGLGSAVTGGVGNTASGPASSVSGGNDNTASGGSSSVSGGGFNLASGISSSVSGGSNVTAPDDNDWAAGSLFEDFEL
ncbi:hypothetical protein MYX76_14905 [Desulfobacterota bacterium AH_259_B03_O07]|nr:hypothetical protein [Desulfobacterota bacterium AH_259_B03_O07]